MNAIILAAGRGSRLGTIGNDVPKCLLKINGRTALERLAESIELAGTVKNVFVVGGYRIDAIRAQIPADWVLIENDQYETTNSLYSLSLALKQFHDGDVAVFNSDVVYDSSLIVNFLNHPCATACLVDELATYDWGEFHVRVEDGMIAEISRSVPASESFGRDAQIFKVASEHGPLFRSNVNELILAGGSDCYSGKTLEMLASSALLDPVFTNGRIWSEFDTEDQYLRCQEIFAQLDTLPHNVDAYGITSIKPDQTDQGHFEHVSSSLSRVFRRGIRYLREWRIPTTPESRRLLKAAVKYSPLRTGRLLWLLASSSMSLAGFRVSVFGAGMLADVMKESAKLGIRPFLLWGTLLGCVREGRFLRHDKDVDLGFLDSDFLRVNELRDRLIQKGYSVRKQSEYKISFYHPLIKYLHIDIDSMHETSESVWSTNTTSDVEYIFSYYFSRAIFAGFKKLKFEGMDVLIPVGAEQFLEAVYGNWQVPQKRKGSLRGPLNLRIQRKKDGAPNGTRNSVVPLSGQV